MTPLVLDNEQLSLTVLPQLGGKWTSLRRHQTGREFLLQPPEREVQEVEYGTPFEEADTSGWDECFPTVGPCSHGDVQLPDHGEVWCLPWETLQYGRDSWSARVEGRALPYRLTRTVALRGESIEVSYSLEHLGDLEFPYLWSAHPLLAVEPGDQVVLPASLDRARVQWSAGERLSGEIPWMPALAQLGPAEAGSADKLFFGPLQQGWAALAFTRTEEFLRLRFEAPYLGLWLCQGGWPVSRPAKHYTVALEPCNAPADALSSNTALAVVPRLKPGTTHHWSLRLEIGDMTEGWEHL